MINLQKRKNIGIFGLVGLLLAIMFFSGIFKTKDALSTDVIHRGNSIEPASLDPHLSQSLNEANIQRDIFEGLTAESANGSIIPGVAERWETSSNKLKWTFFLRKNAKWSNGTPVTAHDFVNGFRRAVDRKVGSTCSVLLSPISGADKILKGEENDITKLGIIAIDDYTLEINLEAPTPYLLNLLAHHITYPFPQAVYEQHKAKWTTPGNIICNGPYTLAEWTPQSHIKLVKNDMYWDKSHVKTSTVFYYPTEDIHAELKRFIAGTIHTTEAIPPDQLEWVQQNMQGSFRNSPYPGIIFYAFNMTIDPFKNNLKLRQALALAIDRKLITDKIVKLGSIPAYFWIPNNMDSYKHQEVFFASMKQEERENKAKELFAEAGFSVDKPLHLEILLNANNFEKNLSIAIAEMWKKNLGIEVTFKAEEWKDYVNSRTEKKFQIVHLKGVADFPFASSFLEIFMSEKNTAGYANPEFDQFVKSGLAETDPTEQNKHFAKAEATFLNDLPIIPLFQFTKRRLVDPFLKGWEDNLMDVHPSKYLILTEKP